MAYSCGLRLSKVHSPICVLYFLQNPSYFIFQRCMTLRKNITKKQDRTKDFIAVAQPHVATEYCMLALFHWKTCMLQLILQDARLSHDIIQTQYEVVNIGCIYLYVRILCNQRVHFLAYEPPKGKGVSLTTLYW